MRRRAFLGGMTGGVVLACAGILPARTQDGLTGVVELFTSQGCSSCPPADAALAAFSRDPGILALGYHVDYWDYLGWKDTLASPSNTERQHAYRAAMGARTVYTPQAVINGREHLNGARADLIRQKLGDYSSAGDGLTVPVDVAVAGDRLTIGVGSGAKPAGADTLLTIVYFRSESPVVIARGENAGRTMTYANAVIATQTLGMWDGKAMDVHLPSKKLAEHDADGCAVLLQSMTPDGDPGPILGAANLSALKTR